MSGNGARHSESRVNIMIESHHIEMGNGVGDGWLGLSIEVLGCEIRPPSVFIIYSRIKRQRWGSPVLYFVFKAEYPYRVLMFLQVSKLPVLDNCCQMQE